MLWRSLGVVGDYRVGGLEDRLGRPIVLIEDDHPSIGIVLLEVPDVTDVRTAKLVDRLVGITDHAQVAMRRRQLFDQHVLSPVGVLVLIHEDIPEPLLIVLEHIGKRREHLHRHHQQIIEVHRRRFHQTLLIQPIDVGYLLVKKAIPLIGERLEVNQLALGLGDDSLHRLLGKPLGVEVEIFGDHADEPQGVSVVIDREARSITEPGRLASENSHAR